MTSFIIWVIVGGSVGWLANTTTQSTNPQFVLLDIIAGAFGAFLGSLIMGSGRPVAPDYSWLSFAAACAGAIILLAIIAVIRRRGTD